MTPEEERKKHPLRRQLGKTIPLLLGRLFPSFGGGRGWFKGRLFSPSFGGGGGGGVKKTPTGLENLLALIGYRTKVLL
jgi:uncharacterized spore protein YtfJ